MKNVPNQYKKIIDKQTNIIMTAAEKLWPFVQELGDNYECECGDIVIIIRKKETITHEQAL